MKGAVGVNQANCKRGITSSCAGFMDVMVDGKRSGRSQPADDTTCYESFLSHSLVANIHVAVRLSLKIFHFLLQI